MHRRSFEENGENNISAIGRVVDLKKTHTHLKHKDKLNENEMVLLLLREWRHFQVHGDGILRRETATRIQLLVPEVNEASQAPTRGIGTLRGRQDGGSCKRAFLSGLGCDRRWNTISLECVVASKGRSLTE